MCRRHRHSARSIGNAIGGLWREERFYPDAFGRGLVYRRNYERATGEILAIVDAVL